jgi:DNA-binding transcriptional LysR family regulator
MEYKPMRASSLRARHLTVFLAVARAGSMQRAAPAAHLTQPAISKLIGELEGIFGRPMFERSKRGVTLTECGEVLVERAEALLNDLDHAAVEIDNIARGIAGNVRIGVLPVAEARIVPATLLALRKRAPSLIVSIEEGTRLFLLAGLRKGEIDCVIGRLDDSAAEDDLHREALVPMPVRIVSRPTHPLARRRRMSLADLAAYPWIVPQAGVSIRRAIDRQFAEAGIAAPVPAIESSSDRLNCAVLARTDMIAVMTDDGAKAYSNSGEVVMLPIKVAGRLPAVGVMTRASYVSNSLKTFLQVLRDTVR